MTITPTIKLDGTRRVIHTTDSNGLPVARIIPLTGNGVKPFLVWRRFQKPMGYFK